MTRLIDGDALIDAWRNRHNIEEGDTGAVFVGYSEIPNLINKQPTIEERTEGEWLGDYCPYTCSKCGKKYETADRFCRYCGDDKRKSLIAKGIL